MTSFPKIAGASAGSIDSGLNAIAKKHLGQKRWLSPRNRYAKGTIYNLEDDWRGKSVVASDLAQYLAASVPLHCLDGWSFLSRGVESLLKGDIPSAIHMAYYAELRAVMCVLARGGIGVFNSHHFYFNSSNAVDTVNRLDPKKTEIRVGTHKFAPSAIDDWAEIPGNSVALLGAISIKGKSLKDWFDATGIGSATSMFLAREWLKNWSVDLSYVEQDHVLRNEMSYRPHSLSVVCSENKTDRIINQIREFWRACEPANSGGSRDSFFTLDSHLLRIGLERLYYAHHGSNPIGRGYRSFLSRTFDIIGLSTHDSFFQFVCRNRRKGDHDVLKNARRKTLTRVAGTGGASRFVTRRRHISSEDSLGIISRALLMLRFASGQTADLLGKGSVGKTDVEFWLSDIGTGTGLWEKGNPPVVCSDLWEEIASSIAAIDLAKKSGGAIKSLYDADQRNIVRDLSVLSQFHRAGMWGMGL